MRIVRKVKNQDHHNIVNNKYELEIFKLLIKIKMVHMSRKTRLSPRYNYQGVDKIQDNMYHVGNWMILLSLHLSLLMKGKCHLELALIPLSSV